MTEAQVALVVGSNMTAQAVSAAAATAYATAEIATAVYNAQIVTATHEAGMATATEDARLSQADQQRVDLALSVDSNNATAAAALNTQALADNAARLAAENDRRLKENTLSYIRGIVLIVFLSLAGLVILALTCLKVYDFIDRAIQRRRALALLAGKSPIQDAPAPARISITGPTTPAPELTTGQTSYPRLTADTPIAALPANTRSQLLRSQAYALRQFDANIAQWKTYEGSKALVGVGLDGPITFDPAIDPHMLWTGSSRRGKSSNAKLYLSALIRLGYYIVILNERASDYAAMSGHSNVTNLRAYSDSQRLDFALETIRAAVLEMDRRDQILQARGLNSWAKLIAAEPEAPPLFILIDEAIELCQAGGRGYQDELLSLIYKLVSQAGKFSIGIGLCATDPTARQLGDIGYGVIQQCGRVVFGFNSDSPSRSVLGDTSAVGLPPGQFIAVKGDGERVAGLGFNTDTATLINYVNGLPVANLKPPPAVARLTGPAVYLSGNSAPAEDLQEKDPALARLLADSALIGQYSGSKITSRTAIADRLRADGHPGWGSTGENIKRVELALEYRARVFSDTWAASILSSKPTTALAAEDRERLSSAVLPPPAPAVPSWLARPAASSDPLKAK